MKLIDELTEVLAGGGRRGDRGKGRRCLIGRITVMRIVPATDAKSRIRIWPALFERNDLADIAALVSRLGIVRHWPFGVPGYSLLREASETVDQMRELVPGTVAISNGAGMW